MLILISQLYSSTIVTSTPIALFILFLTYFHLIFILFLTYFHLISYLFSSYFHLISILFQSYKITTQLRVEFQSMDRGHQGVVSLKEMEHAVEQALVSTHNSCHSMWFSCMLFLCFVIFQLVLFSIISYFCSLSRAVSDCNVTTLYLQLIYTVRAISLSQALTQDWIWIFRMHLNQFVWNTGGKQLLMWFARVSTAHQIYVRLD